MGLHQRREKNTAKPSTLLTDVCQAFKNRSSSASPRVGTLFQNGPCQPMFDWLSPQTKVDTQLLLKLPMNTSRAPRFTHIHSESSNKTCWSEGEDRAFYSHSLLPPWTGPFTATPSFLLGQGLSQTLPPFSTVTAYKEIK